MALHIFALVISLFGFAATKYINEKVEKAFSFLGACFAISLFLYPIQTYQEVYWVPTWVLTIFILIHILNAFILNNGTKIFFISLLPLLFLINGEKLSFGEYKLITSSTSFIGHVYLGFLFPFVLYLKSYFLKKWLEIDEIKTIHIVWPFIIGLLLFAGYFHHSFSGILAVIIGLFMFALSDEIRSNELLTSLMFFSAAFGFYGMSYLPQNTIISSNVLLSLGLATGAFSLLNMVNFKSSKAFFSKLLLLIIACLSLLIPLYLGGKNISFGGQGAFVVALIFMGFLSNTTFENIEKSTFIRVFYTFSMGIALFIFSLQNENYKLQRLQANFDSSRDKNELDKEFQKVESSPFEAIAGNYTIAQENFEFNFELGPKDARTKGAFKEIAGEIILDKKISNSSFKITLPVKSLTTFESSRDEAIMSEYFFLEKFPSITFNSTSVSESGNGITVKGNFTMIGVTKETEVNLKFTGNKKINGKEFPVLQGVGYLDRTVFGMEPDPSIGNVVDYKFSILLKEK
jgi:polyisoprenoid-binding protein YceI